jgi:hypothetical protein
MDALLMPLFSNGQFIAALHAERNPLVVTDAESELLRRFEALVDDSDDVEPIREVLDEYDVSADEIRLIANATSASWEESAEMLKKLSDEDIDTPDKLGAALSLLAVLDAHGIDSPEELRTEIELAQQLRELAKDAGDTFARASQLITTVQE